MAKKIEVNHAVHQAVKMVNIVGLRRAAGDTYEWSRGMIKHYSDQLQKNVNSVDDIAYVINNLTDDSRAAILEYYKIERSLDKLSDYQLSCLVNTGLLINVDPNDGEPY